MAWRGEEMGATEIPVTLTTINVLYVSIGEFKNNPLKPN